MINGENTKKFSWIIDWFYKGFLSGSSWSLFTVSSSPLFVNPFSSQCFYLSSVSIYMETVVLANGYPSHPETQTKPRLTG